MDDVRSPLLTEMLAHYVIALGQAARLTKRAEDRSRYKSLLADAAVLLARAAAGESPELLRDTAKAHERLWGQTWLVDPAHEKPSRLWQEAFREINGNVN